MSDCSGPNQTGNVARPEADAPPIEPRSDRATPRRIALLTLLVAVVAAAIVTGRFTPRFSHWSGLNIVGALERPEYGRAKATLDQVDNPWAPVTASLHTVISWRLLFPVVWHYLHLPPWLLLATPLVGCVLVLWLVAWLTYRRLHGWSATWLAAALFATLPWFFVSSGWLLHFDSWLVLGLLTVAFVPSPWALAAACLATPWIDERFLLALPVCVVVRGVSYDWAHRPKKRKILLELAVVAAASLPYTALRAGVWLHGDRIATAYVQFWSSAATVPWTRFLEGLWSGFRAGWVVILAAVVLGARRAGWPCAAAFIVIILGTAVGGLFIAMDMSRTLMMISPVLLLGVWLWESWRPAALRFVLPAVVAANLVLPAAHVMWHDKIDISCLPLEIHEWRNPPEFLAAARLINEAEQSFGAGRPGEGSAKLDQAILLAPVYSNAFVKRAALRMQSGDYAAAAPDLEKALELDDENPTGLFLRGIIRGSRQQTALAADDFRKALAHAPADWPACQDAEQFMQAATSAIEPAAIHPVP